MLERLKKAVEKHDSCKLHKHCIALDRQRAIGALQRSVEQSQAANEETIKQKSPATIKMFDLVYTEAYLYYPFASHETLLQTVKRLLDSEALGKNHQSRFSAA